MPPRKRPQHGMDTFTKVVIVITVFALIMVATGAFYHYKNNKSYYIDSVEVDSIDSPYLSGNITVEVDYMEYCEVRQSDLDEISEGFSDYGIYITFILDEEIPYKEEVNDIEVETYYKAYRNQNHSSYILIASKYSENSRTLGGIYNSEKIVVFKDRIHSVFDDAYEELALQYVIMHEMGHAYGAEHSDNAADIMYPYISQSKLILYPDPQFYDQDSLDEFRD
jgi:predicted Zn-dependent protease